MKKKGILLVFLPLVFLAGGFIYFFFMTDSLSEKEIMESLERSSLAFAVEIIQEDISDAFSDLEILSSSQLFSDFPVGAPGDSFPMIERLFSHYSESKRIYESIFFVGLNGMEIIRIDNHDGHPKAAPKESLVSMSGTECFEKASAMVTGEIHMSFVEDVAHQQEGGTIQEKSFLFCSPVFSSGENRIGVMVIEYRLSTLSERLSNIFTRSPGKVMIVDDSGNWIIPPINSLTSATSTKPQVSSFALTSPNVWEIISEKGSGQVNLAGGLFTFNEFSSPKSFHSHFTQQTVEEKRKTWKIISRIPPDLINEHSKKLFQRLVIFFLLFVLASLLFLRYVDYGEGKLDNLPFKMVSPFTLMTATIIIIFVSEFIVMMTLQAIPNLPPLLEAAVDASMLSLFILPMITVLLFQPLVSHIKERQLKEEELKRSEESVKAIIKSAGEGIVVVDDKMIISMVNEELLTIFGYTENELLGENISIISDINGDEHNQFQDSGFFKNLMAASGKRIKISGRRKSGEIFSLEARMEQVSSPTGHSYVGALRDITERELAQLALAQSEEKFRSSFENAAIGMVLTNLEGKFLQVNHSFCDMLGYNFNELLDKNFADISHPDELDEDLGNISRAIAGKIDSFQMEKRYIHKNANHVWAILNVAIVRDENKDPSFFIAQIEDITDRKNTELELLRSKEEAEQATLLKDKFVSLVAHDLRSPYVSISGLLKLMLMDGGKELSEKQALMLKTSLEASEQSVLLIDELLNISRLKTGVLTPSCKFLDAHNTAIIAISSQGHIATRKNITIKNLIPEKSRVYADPRLFTEVISNLLGNAIKFSSFSGTVEISALGGGRTGIAVKDAGVGVKKEYLGKLFRYDEKTHDKGTMGESGTGLGLPLSYDIMLAHGGTLECVLPESGGSVFQAILPKITPRILVVEKDKAIVELLEEGLKGEGVEFVETTDYSDASDIAENSLIHLIFIDLEDNLNSGLEIIRRITARKKNQDLPVIVITAHNQANDAEKALGAGASDFVTKPLDVEAMIARVHRFII